MPNCSKTYFTNHFYGLQKSEKYMSNCSQINIFYKLFLWTPNQPSCELWTPNEVINASFGDKKK